MPRLIELAGEIGSSPIVMKIGDIIQLPANSVSKIEDPNLMLIGRFSPGFIGTGGDWIEPEGDNMILLYQAQKSGEVELQLHPPFGSGLEKMENIRIAIETGDQE